MQNEDYQKSNREKRQVPKAGKFWCGCDRDKIGLGEKCTACGHVYTDGTLKKGAV